ncbi:MAG: ATP-binding protein [Bacteroidia bacterium]|nr:ATP-binding protein [Bacteroidia bacterium]
MIPRMIEPRLLQDLSWSPVVGLVGPRQAGKTTLARHIRSQLAKQSVYLDLELQEDWFKLEDAQSYLSGHADKTVIIDEIQVRPELFALLRALTDQRREPGRFLLLGSASPHIIKLSTETLAGRITYHELTPFALPEVEASGMELHWIRGGFPESLLAASPERSRRWLYDFTETFIFRDLLRLGFAVPPAVLRNLLQMIAHTHGGLLSTSNLAASLGVSSRSVNQYLELLEGSFLIRRLPPYYANAGKRLVKSPKLYFRDSGLHHSLLRIFDMESLRGSPAAGASWEGYVIEQIIRTAPPFSDFYFYRTQHGAESDLLMITPSGKKVCIEIKFSVAPAISKGFYQSVADLQPEHQYIITPGGERFARSNGLIICPLSVFLREDLPLLL